MHSHRCRGEQRVVGAKGSNLLLVLLLVAQARMLQRRQLFASAARLFLAFVLQESQLIFQPSAIRV